MIIPSSKYPSQTAIDLVNYPHGKARNVTASGDGTGTPFEKEWLNDMFGFFQALVSAAGITPSGNPDTAVASQLLDAVRAVQQQRTIAYYLIDVGVQKAIGVSFTMALVAQYGGFTMLSNHTVIVPTAGKYRVTFAGNFSSAAATNPLRMAASLWVNASAANAPGQASVQQRYSANTADEFGLSGDTIIDVTTPSASPIQLVSATVGGIGVSTQALLTVERVR